MKLKIYLRSGEYILDPDVPVLFLGEFCCFTDIEGKTHSVLTKELTGISVIGGFNG